MGKLPGRPIRWVVSFISNRARDGDFRHTFCVNKAQFLTITENITGTKQRARFIASTFF